MKKFLVILISILLAVASGFAIYFGIKYKTAYDDGYTAGTEDLSAYEQIIESSRKEITSLTVEVNQLRSQVEILNQSNSEKQVTIRTLTNQKNSLETEIHTLQQTNQYLNQLISDNEILIEELSSNNDELSNENSELRSRVDELETANNELNLAKVQNEESIRQLTIQLTNLNNELSEKNALIEAHDRVVTELLNRIESLEKSIEYYEYYIAELELENQITLTFMYDDSVYQIQRLDIGNTTSIENPTSTEYLIFNGWTVEGQPIDLNTYVFTENTVIVADLTYKYLVEFVIDEEVVDTQIVLKDNYVSEIEIPYKEGYEFDGWSKDGQIVNVSSDIIYKHTRYIAIFTKIHTVSFVIKTPLPPYVTDGIFYMVRNEEYVDIQDPTPINEDWKFAGWSIEENSSELINLEEYPIREDLTLYAVFIKLSPIITLNSTFEEENMEFNFIESGFSARTKYSFDIVNTRIKEQYSDYNLQGIITLKLFDEIVINDSNEIVSFTTKLIDYEFHFNNYFGTIDSADIRDNDNNIQISISGECYRGGIHFTVEAGDLKNINGLSARNSKYFVNELGTIGTDYNFQMEIEKIEFVESYINKEPCVSDGNFAAENIFLTIFNGACEEFNYQEKKYMSFQGDDRYIIGIYFVDTEENGRLRYDEQQDIWILEKQVGSDYRLIANLTRQN